MDAKLEALVNDYTEAQAKMAKERARLQHLVTLASRRHKDAARAGHAREERFYKSYERLSQVLLSQIDQFKTDALPSTGSLIAIKWNGVEVQMLLLLLDMLNMEQLHEIVQEDFAPALAGEAPARRYPQAWLTVRERLATSSEWQQALRAFEMDFPNFKQAVERVASEYEELSAVPLTPEHFNRAKALELPSLKGMHYRIETLFRKLPLGHALLEGTRIRPVDVAGGEAPPVKEATPVKRITGILKGLFK